MSTSQANAKQKEDDLGLIVKYIKNDLYPKVKFIYDAKVDLAVGGKIYRDYLNRCRDRIGGRSLTDQSRNDYMEALWTTGMTTHLQKNALAAKRSAIYTVMQNKFSGECLWGVGVARGCIKTFGSNTNTHYFQICVKYVSTGSVSCCPSKAWRCALKIQRPTMSSTSSSTSLLLVRCIGRNAWMMMQGALEMTPPNRLLFCSLQTITRHGSTRKK